MYDVVKFIQGDEQELEHIIHELTPSIMKYCVGILLNFADAEDAVQTTFIRMYERRATIREPLAFLPFVYRIAYSVSIDILRTRRIFRFAEPMQSSSNTGYISDELREALETLNPLDRAIVYGRAVEEYSYTELSIIHGKNETLLRKRYERARKRLGKLLAKSYDHQKEREETVV